MELENKVVLITGSSQGIGKAAALEFAKHKAKLVITYNSNEKKAQEVADECSKLGSPEVITIKLDVSDSKSIKLATESVLDHFKGIDILINNAGVLAWKNLDKQSDEEIENQIRVNVEGLIKMTRDAGQYASMIINIASGAGKTGFAGIAPYCGTKFAVRGFTQSMAQEVPDKKWYVVNPGMTKTAMTNNQGRPVEDVGQVIVNTALEKYDVDNGGDVDVFEVMPREKDW